MNLTKNPLAILFFGGVVAIMLLAYFDETGGLPKPTSTGSNSGNASSQSTRYITTGLIPKGTWPPVDSESQISVASDPMASNYYVVLDASGSMDGPAGNARKMDSAKMALKSFAMSLPEDANLGLSTFSPAREIIPLGTNNRSEFLTALEKVDAHGGTPLVQSIKKGYESLTEQARQQSGYGRYILLIVTDGKSSDGDPSPITRDIVNQSAIEIQTIGFGVTDHALNIKGVTQYYTANSVDTLLSALDEVLASETEAFVDPTSFTN